MVKRIFVSLLILNLGSGCGQKSSAPGTEMIEKPAAIAVKAEPIQELPIAETLKFTGEVNAFSEVQIFPRVNGVITQEYVALGQAVKKGQTLAEMVQDIPGLEYLSVKIEATIDGHITMDMVEVGSRINLQQPAYQISQINRINVKAKINESVLGRIKTGDPVQVTVDAFPGETFNGRIADLSPLLDRVSRTAEAKITLANPRLRLKPGMFARIEIALDKQNALTVPVDAVIFSGLNPYVFAVKKNIARQVSVRTGALVDQKIVILGNIQAGDSVVVFGQNLLEDGASVRVVEGY